MRVQKRATPTAAPVSVSDEAGATSPLSLYSTTVPLNCQCHQRITVEQAERLLAEHHAAIRAAYPDPDAMCRVARERTERIGLVRWVNGGAMLVGRPHVGFCPVCDG